MMMPDDHLRQAVTRLQAVGVPSPQNDARLLWEHAQNNDVEFERLLTLREQRVPLQHIMGVAYFRHLAMNVGPGVFVPRPETELLAQVAIDHLLDLHQDERIAVDLCSGSGAVALAIATEVPFARVHAVELSREAFEFLQANVSAYEQKLEQMKSEVILYQADATDITVLRNLGGTVRAVVSNPPYIPDDMIPREPEVLNHDPSMALFGGADGLDVARGVIQVAQTLLVRGGIFGMEHADVQGESVVRLFDQKWCNVVDHLDYNNVPRFVTANFDADTDIA